MTIVRAAITQVAWTGDKESMIARHEQLARTAADAGVQVIGFQELFYGPYFGIIRTRSTTPTSRRSPARRSSGSRRSPRSWAW